MAAIAHGCAIITTTPEVDLPEVQHRCHAFLIARDAPDALAVAIKTLATDSTLRSTLQRNALELSSSFGWDHIAAQTVTLFAEIIGAARS